MSMTRDNAFIAHQASGKAGTQAARIVDLLRGSALPLLRDEIAGRLRMLPTSVCGRIAELKKAGLVVEDGERLNPVSGIACVTYRVARPDDLAGAEQADLFGSAA